MYHTHQVRFQECVITFVMVVFTLPLKSVLLQLANFVDDNSSANANSVAVENFWASHATCSQKCTEAFLKNDIEQMRNDCQGLDVWVENSNKLNLVLMGKAQVIMSTTFASPSKKRNLAGRKKARCHFMIHGQKVCKDFFLFAHTISKKRWEDVINTYKKEGKMINLSEVEYTMYNE